MAAYIEKSKRLNAKVREFVERNNLSNEEEAALYNIMFDAMKVLPRVQHVVKANAMREVVGRNNEQVEVKNVRKEGRDGQAYDTIDFFPIIKSGNPFS